MKFPSITLLGLALLAPLPAIAESTSPHHFAVTGWLVSDYVFRGLSQNDEDPALQVGLDYTHDSGFYAGAWASPVDFNDQSGADLEVDTYVGYTHKLGDSVTGDVQLIRYNYPGTESGVNLDYNEVIGKLTFIERIILLVGYSNDVFSSGQSGLYTNVTVNWSLPYELTLATGIGHYRFEKGLYSAADGYTDYSVGLSRVWGKLTTALTYTDTNNSGVTLFGKIAENRVALSLKYRF